MEALLGWLPLLGLGLAGVLMGVAARTRGPRTRVLVVVSPAMLFVVAVVLVRASPPCPDLLDGRCEQNWVSEVAAIVGFVLFPLALTAAATMGVAAGLVATRRRVS